MASRFGAIGNEGGEAVPAHAARRVPWRRRALAPFARTGRALRDLLMPARCPGCGDLAIEPGLCGTCWAEVPWIAEPVCDRLGLPLPFDLDAGGVSLAARAEPPPYARARAVALHEGPARRMIHVLKYQDRQDLTNVMGLWMARAGAPILNDADLMLPVPLHWRRLVRRGFNQADVLAQAAAQHAGVPVVQGLARARATRRQVGLGGAARRRNVAGAFRVRDDARGRIAGACVILVDDVITTGATVDACTRALNRAGAVEVRVLAFSRVARDLGEAVIKVRTVAPSA